MKNSAIETECCDIQHIYNFLELLRLTSKKTESALETIDHMIADSKDIDTAKQWEN